MPKIAVMDAKFEEMRKKYYQEETVQFLLIESMKFREGAFIKLPTEDKPNPATVRCVKASAVRFLRMNMQRFDFISQACQMYSSVARFSSMPVFSFNLAQRRKEQDDFNNNFWGYMDGYDFLADIDNPDLRIAYATAYRVKQIFDAAKVPYTIIFSGNKGFHIRVFYEDFSDDMKALPKQDLIDLLKKFAENFRAVNGLHSLDLSIFDGRRLGKAVYSLCYNDYLIALPLTDEQMENFKLEEMSLPYWLAPENFKRLYKRGLLKREGKPEAFGNLVQKYLRI